MAIGHWDHVVRETKRPWPYEKSEVWLEGSIAICVCYRDGKAVLKTMEIRVPPWRVKVREWLDWLRGLVGKADKTGPKRILDGANEDPWQEKP
jgi:hypothetical protein